MVLPRRGRGGARKGAGRKPKGARAGVPHRARPLFKRLMPLHVTLRMAPTVYNLRSRRSFRILERAFLRGADRFGARILRFSIQGNHIHLLVEAGSTPELCRAVKGLSIRIAKGMNRMMSRRGQVIGDRYHARLLRTPTEVKHVTHYLSNNDHHHYGERPRGVRLDPFTSESPWLGFSLPVPTCGLIHVAWRQRRPG